MYTSARIWYSDFLNIICWNARSLDSQHMNPETAQISAFFQLLIHLYQVFCVLDECVEELRTGLEQKYGQVKGP